MKGPATYPTEPEARAAVERYEATLAELAREAEPLIHEGAFLHRKLMAAMEEMRTALRACDSLGARQRRSRPLDYSPFIPLTVEALDNLAKADRVRTGEVVVS